MSRSKRKAPFFPRTTSVSEKDDKRLAHRKERAYARDALGQLDHEEEIEPYTEHPRSGQWVFDKDGKTYDPASSKKNDPSNISFYSRANWV